MRGGHRGALTGAGGEAEAVGEPDVDDGKHDEPSHQCARVAVHDTALDRESDEDRHQRLAGLVAHAQHRTDGDIPALSAHRTPQDVPSRRVRFPHASSGPDPQRPEAVPTT